jgi:hypothetical protein
MPCAVSCHLQAGCHSADGEDQSQDSTGVQDNLEEESADDMPTVLAEFSSVVADTQQYIVADHMSAGDSGQVSQEL